jgi:hypothetical protein
MPIALIPRARRLVRRFREVRTNDGLFAAIRLVIRYTYSRIPLLRSSLFATRGKAKIHRTIALLRSDVSPTTPILALVVRGGLGDHIQTARFIRDLAQHSEGFSFDVYTLRPAIAAWVFASVTGFHAAYDPVLLNESYYDATLDILHFVTVRRDSLLLHRIESRPNLLAAVHNIMAAFHSIGLCAAHSPQLDNLLAQKAIFSNCTSANFLHHLAGVPYGGPHLSVATSKREPFKSSLDGRQYITVHNGFDRQFVMAGSATKVYPHLSDVVQAVKKKHPGILIVQIGDLVASTPVPSVDIDLLGKTTLPEAAGLIDGALLHIDSEGGLVHIAAAVCTPSAVIFGPTPPQFFAYEANINIPPRTCGGCWWTNETWMTRCPRGLPEPVCMTQDPLDVAATINEWIAQEYREVDCAKSTRTG